MKKLFLSPSAISSLSCRYKFYLKYIYGVNGEWIQSDAAKTGTEVHNYFEGKRKDLSAKALATARIIKKKWGKQIKGGKSEQKLFRKVGEFNGWELWLYGIIDYLKPTESIDFKTTSKASTKDDWMYYEAETRHSFQGKFYELMTDNPTRFLCAATPSSKDLKKNNGSIFADYFNHKRNLEKKEKITHEFTIKGASIEELHPKVLDIQSCLKTNNWTRNESACSGFYKCPFYKYCLFGDDTVLSKREHINLVADTPSWIIENYKPAKEEVIELQTDPRLEKLLLMSDDDMLKLWDEVHVTILALINEKVMTREEARKSFGHLRELKFDQHFKRVHTCTRPDIAVVQSQVEPANIMSYDQFIKELKKRIDKIQKGCFNVYTPVLKFLTDGGQELYWGCLKGESK